MSDLSLRVLAQLSRREGDLTTMEDHGTEHQFRTAHQLEGWREIVTERVRHHQQHYHRDVRKADDAVDLLESVAATLGDLGPEEMMNGLDDIAVAAEETPEAAMRRQLQSLRRVSEALQMAIDIVRAQQHLQMERSANAGPGKFPPSGSLATPHHASSHSDVQANIFSVLEFASTTQVQRVDSQEQRLAKLSVSAPLAELSAAVRDAVAANMELSNAASQLEALAAHLESTTEDIDPFVLPCSGMVIPTDIRDWPRWAQEMSQLCTRNLPSSSSSRATTAPQRHGVLVGDDGSDFTKRLESSEAFTAWVMLCQDVYTESRAQILDLVQAASLPMPL